MLLRCDNTTRRLSGGVAAKLQEVLSTRKRFNFHTKSELSLVVVCCPTQLFLKQNPSAAQGFSYTPLRPETTSGEPSDGVLEFKGSIAEFYVPLAVVLQAAMVRLESALDHRDFAPH